MASKYRYIVCLSTMHIWILMFNNLPMDQNVLKIDFFIKVETSQQLVHILLTSYKLSSYVIGWVAFNSNQDTC